MRKGPRDPLDSALAFPRDVRVCITGPNLLLQVDPELPLHRKDKEWEGAENKLLRPSLAQKVCAWFISKYYLPNPVSVQCNNLTGPSIRRPIALGATKLAARNNSLSPKPESSWDTMSSAIQHPLHQAVGTSS